MSRNYRYRALLRDNEYERSLFSKVKSLLAFDGADASTTFTDTTGKVWTAAGNAQLDTAQQKFGTASGLFDGTGDQITTPDHDDWDISSRDFTFEAHIRLNAEKAQTIWSKRNGATTTSGYMFGVNATSALIWSSWNADGIAGTVETIENALSLNTWYHVAITQHEHALYLYIDGVLRYHDWSYRPVDNTSVVYIGGDAAVAARNFNGWIDNARYSHIARYTGQNFTPPTAAYPTS